jgi:hypothetical protein
MIMRRRSDKTPHSPIRAFLHHHVAVRRANENAGNTDMFVSRVLQAKKGPDKKYEDVR